MKIVLASASPRRRELLKKIADNFTVDPAVGEELAEKGLTPAQTACRLAEHKCDEVFARHSGDAEEVLVVACDTIVVFDGKILGKPKDVADAVRTLTALSGNDHLVITAVCVRSHKGKRVDFAETKVTFNRLSPEFIESYVKGGSPMDKAGSYGIQDGGIVASYEGSYENVVGLPLELTKKLIDEISL